MQDIGAKLRAKRQELGYRIEEIVEKTKLHPSALHDIEDGNLSNISPAYLRGFLRVYAKFLDVDISEELKDIPSAQNVDKKPKPQKIPVQKPVVAPIKQVDPPAPAKPVNPVKTVINLQTSHRAMPHPAQKPWVKPHASLQDAEKTAFKFYLSPKMLKNIGIALAAILVLLIIFKGIVPSVVRSKEQRHAAQVQAQERKAQEEYKKALALQKKKEKTRRAQNRKKTLAAQKLAQSQREAKAKAAAAQAAAAKEQAKNIIVSVTTKKDCFVRANVDGKVLFESVLRKGVAKTWRAQKEIDLKIGDGSAVVIEVNGAEIPRLSARSRVIKSLKINAQGISVSK